MVSTPVLTPEIESAFLNDIGVQLSSCFGTAQDWTPNVWLDHSIPFVG